MTFSADDLATLLDEANHAPWESVRAALATIDGQPHPRVGWLTGHLSATKRDYWTLVAAATGTPAPDDAAGLTRLMAWEVDAARALSADALQTRLTHSDESMTVSELLRLNARHTAWHAGQIAALANPARLA
ncbi:DinB family protein [Deinococcus frigens]|uniref:DinB family protein n=1 Tax=Deinococcus frigens TaxID=249403 RepID=UPI00049685E8|nr:DinB family protein [Deinococcus frigens]